MTLFGKGSQVETMRYWPVQPNLTFKGTLHTEAHFVPNAHMEHVETDYVWRVI